MGSRGEQKAWNELALAVVKQAVNDWRGLCEGKIKENKDCNFHELEQFFEGGCGFYLYQTGISPSRIYRELCRERGLMGEKSRQKAISARIRQTEHRDKSED